MLNENKLYNQLNHIISTIVEMSMISQNIVIAIDGMCASGKTTISKILEKEFGCRVIHMDDFFLPPHLRTKERLLEVGGNVDYDRFILDVINNLHQGITYSPFNCKTLSFDKEINLPLTNITLIEGSYALHPKFGKYYDLAIFIEVSSVNQIDRIINRNGIDELPNFQNKWIKFENQYFNTFKIKDNANFIINTSDSYE